MRNVCFVQDSEIRLTASEGEKEICTDMSVDLAGFLLDRNFVIKLNSERAWQ